MGPIVAGTGHRPKRLEVRGQAPYRGSAYAALVAFAAEILTEMLPGLVITGGALGWDQALADAAIQVGAPFDVYKPFAGMEAKWPESSQRRFRAILEKARQVVAVCDPGYADYKMQRRNEAMVDASGRLLALWDGRERGGTWNCVAYARTREIDIVGLWPRWQKFLAR